MKFESVMELMELSNTCYIQQVTAAVEELLNNRSEDEEDENIKQFYSLTEVLLTREHYVGTQDDFHNLAVDYAKAHYEDLACGILTIGLERYPVSIDLLADYLYYGVAANRTEECEKYYERLNEIPKSDWNWRAFSFSINYFSELLGCATDMSIKEEMKMEILKLSKEYKRYFPDREKSYLAMSEVYRLLNKRRSERAELEKAVEKFDNTQQCALRLADICFECGELEKTMDLLIKCTYNGLEPQPGISGGYPYLLLAICKMRMLYKEGGTEPALVRDKETEKRVKDIYLYYNAARSSMGRSSMLTAMEKHIQILELRSGVPRNEDAEYWN